MPNSRNSNQRQVNAWVDESLLEALERGRRILKMERSQFVREAIREKLVGAGLEVPVDLTLRPDRAAALNESAGKHQLGATWSGQKSTKRYSKIRGAKKGKKI